jgi:hypothetical protein
MGRCRAQQEARRAITQQSMPEQQIDYGRLVERALRRVVYDALSTVAEHGLSGRHQLYLTFRTAHRAS